MSATLLTSWDSPHPPDCPAFDYEDHPDWRTVLPARVTDALLRLVSGATDSRGMVVDSRPLHSHLFSGLTPRGHDYFAGHYRGERYRCLEYYAVMVWSDPRVGVPPAVRGRHLARRSKFWSRRRQSCSRCHSFPGRRSRSGARGESRTTQ